MAHYFKFKSVADLEAESARLGLDLRFSDDLRPLFRPVQLGPFTAGNALCVQPMEGCDGTLDGTPDELTFRRYRRFGAGGAKLIWGEAAAVVEEGRANPRQLLVTETNRPPLERMLDDCRQAHREAFGDDDDLVVGLQLTHSGRYSYRRPLHRLHDPILDPRTVVDKATGRTVDAVLSAARRRLPASGWSITTSPRRSWRTGPASSSSTSSSATATCSTNCSAPQTGPARTAAACENRTRLARDIITAIRAEVPGLVIATRLNVFDGIPYRKGPDATTGVPVRSHAAGRRRLGHATATTRSRRT